MKKPRKTKSRIIKMKMEPLVDLSSAGADNEDEQENIKNRYTSTVQSENLSFSDLVKD